MSSGRLAATRVKIASRARRWAWCERSSDGPPPAATSGGRRPDGQLGGFGPGQHQGGRITEAHVQASPDGVALGLEPCRRLDLAGVVEQAHAAADEAEGEGAVDPGGEVQAGQEVGSGLAGHDPVVGHEQVVEAQGHRVGGVGRDQVEAVHRGDAGLLLGRDDRPDHVAGLDVTGGHHQDLDDVPAAHERGVAREVPAAVGAGRLHPGRVGDDAGEGHAGPEPTAGQVGVELVPQRRVRGGGQPGHDPVVLGPGEGGGQAATAHDLQPLDDLGELQARPAELRG